MRPMDHARLSAAMTAWRRNQRLHARSLGREGDSGRLDPPAPGCMDGVDATAEELVAYAHWQTSTARSLAATLQRASVAGMAIEMSGHEIHHETALVRQVLGELRSASPGDNRVAGRVGAAQEALDRLVRCVYAADEITGRQYRGVVTGAQVRNALAGMFPTMSRSGVAVEATEAFLAARLPGSSAAVVPVFLNLVRNAWLWAPRSGRPAVIRLDAYPVTLPPEDPTVDPDDEENGYLGQATTHHVFVVEDSGNGIGPGLEETVFHPFRTGGLGGTGIGLYLCRRNMEANRCTLKVDPAGSALGGARFLVGPTAVLAPPPALPLDRREELALEALAIGGLHLDGRGDEVAANHMDTYALVMEESLRVRIGGARDATDSTLLRAAEAMQGILEGRLGPEALEAFDAATPGGPGPRR